MASRMIQPSEQGDNQAIKDIKDQLFQASMKCKWTEVKELYKNHEFTRNAKLTKSEDTVLHLAISSYHPDRDDYIQQSHFACIKEMVESIPEENRLDILKQENETGNTPLHLAAELGSVPIMTSLVNSNRSELIRKTNKKGETPLFVSAYRGKLQAFLFLDKCCRHENEEGPLELCRRADGDNILHAAISGEYFKLAFQIIQHYGGLVNRYNAEGMSPLHYLSRMPQVFKSGNHFRFIDSIIYHCTNVEELKPKTYKDEGKEDVYLKRDWNLPGNYQTLVEFLDLLWIGTRKVCDYLGMHSGNQENKSKATTEVTNADKKSTGNQNDPENPQIPAKENSNGRLFPANYRVFIQFLKVLMKIALVVLGIGLRKIKKLEEKKKLHTWAVQIMNEMIKREERYKYYESTGEKPEDTDRKKKIGPPPPPPLPPPTMDDGPPPLLPPPTMDDGSIAQQQSPISSIDKENRDGLESEMASKIGIVEMLERILKTSPIAIQDKDSSELSKTTETPLLVASKMGIVEMLERILKEFPIAIQDTDSEEKNILLLAIEHRQTNVYNWIIGEKYPEYVFFQVDKQGNNAMHLAAMYQNQELWRIPGAALQLQGERKWYKYVKHTLPPQSYVRYNNKGQTPREIFRVTHAELLKNGTEWLITTSNSFSVVAALIATVAFATSAAIPGGADDKGQPLLGNEPAFAVFSIASLVSLCFSVSALVFFLAILTSRCQHDDFEKDLPSKLLLGLTSLFASISSVLISFCAAHFFVLQDNYRNAALPIYGVTCVPVVFFAVNQFPLYVDLIRSYIQKLPLRSYKVFYTNSPGESSSNQKKEDKEKDS